MSFDVEFEDIQTLNQMVLAGDGDVIKASIAVAPLIDYELLSSGAALGRGNGPVVVRKVGGEPNREPQRVALPGQHTTAALLFNRYFKGYEPVFMRFSDIAQAVNRGEVSLGVLIHEGRFTFAEHDLELVADLGELWEVQTALPLPLGGIFARKGVDTQLVSRVIRRSVEWAMLNPLAPLDFVRAHATELAPSVMQQHIDLFVNEYTVDLGSEGRRAIHTLLHPQH